MHGHTGGVMRRRWAGGSATVLCLALLSGCATGESNTGTAERAVVGSGKTTSSAPPPSPAAIEIPERLVADARWVERDGVNALEVTPAERLRGETDARVFDEAWRRVVTAVPDADTPGMRDQFLCHASFAAEKEGWFLEPSRPAVGYWNTVRAGCNPGDVIDVG